MKYICEKCKNTKEVDKATIIVSNDKIVTKEAYCKKCDRYMTDNDKFNGFPSIKRTEPTLRRKG